MGRLDLRDGLVALHLGPVERDDLIVQMADFCLQFEGVEWVAVSGKLGPNLVVAVRNHGIGRDNAGEMVKRLFGDIGSAGGHRNMAKAVIPLRSGVSVKARPATKRSNRGCASSSPPDYRRRETPANARHHRNGA